MPPAFTPFVLADVHGEKFTDFVARRGQELAPGSTLHDWNRVAFKGLLQKIKARVGLDSHLTVGDKINIPATQQIVDQRRARSNALIRKVNAAYAGPK